MAENVDKCARCRARYGVKCLWRRHAELARVSVAKTFPRGSLLAIEGIPIAMTQFVRSGRIKLSKSLEDGRELVVGFRGPGSHLGLECLYTNHYPCNVEAVESTSTCSVARDAFARFAQADKGAADEIIRLLGCELEQCRERLRDVALKTARERVASHLLALEACPFSTCRSGVVELESSRQDVSRMIGLRTETLFRVLTDFQGEELIRIHPRSREIQILDREGLERLAC